MITVVSDASFHMITLQAQTLTWLNTQGDSPSDLCAHGTVLFVIDGLEFVTPTDEWTLSATAIYLLRTLEQDHTPDNQVGEHIFPCCGNSMYDVEDSKDVLIVGCQNGIDVSVVHRDGLVVVTSVDGDFRSVSESEWIEAVLRFSREVRSFYDSSAPKEPFDELQQAGFEKMMAEWDRRHPRSAS